MPPMVVAAAAPPAELGADGFAMVPAVPLHGKRAIKPLKVRHSSLR